PARSTGSWPKSPMSSGRRTTSPTIRARWSPESPIGLLSVRRRKISSVRHGEFARHDGTRAWQTAFVGEVSEERENREKDQQLDRIAQPRLRQHLPHQPQRRLRAADRPDGSVEVPPFMSLALG